MDRAPQADDLIFPREDGKQRLVSGTYKQFRQALETLGLARQRQYESRSTFRNLALSAGAAEFHVNLITHPKPKRASDYYTRLEMQWPGMCDAVLAIDPAAWVVANTGASSDEVTAEVTVGVTVEGSANEKPPTTLSVVGGELEREKGFEPAEVAHANRATGHANPQNSPEPQRLQRPSFSAPVRSRPRPSPDSVEAAWRRRRVWRLVTAPEPVEPDEHIHKVE